MKPIYNEIRISHSTIEEKEEFNKKITAQAASLGLTKADYVRLIVELDAATGLVELVKK